VRNACTYGAISENRSKANSACFSVSAMAMDQTCTTVEASELVYTTLGIELWISEKVRDTSGGLN
jgi:hypothetical protein